MSKALYRAYRPKRFEDVLGQDHIINTIKNQIKNNNIGHAYLFSGTRGTGKTSTSKIFSRAVNCLNPVNGSPCNECDICRGIIDGSIMDVIEMDAASNRGVNDIRELRDKVSYPPSYARYKVYIIDEVHMLTQEAFNALLKTLEEPPKHLIFILATTEPEKIPQTILSRCQRFDFKRITISLIEENMKKIIDNLGVEVEDSALSVIARNADGAMRDALSLLEKCISFSDEKITYEDVISILGIVNSDIIFNIVDSVISQDLETILSAINKMIEDGRDINQFIKDIIYHFRDLMIIKSFNGQSPLVEVDSYSMKKYLEQVSNLRLDYIVKILDILSGVDEKSRLSSEPRILLEMAFIKMLKQENLSLEERVEKLESGTIVHKNMVFVDKEDNQKIVVDNSKDTEEEKKVIKKINKVDDKDLVKLRNNWNNLIANIKKIQVSTSVLLRDTEITGYDGNFVDISYPEEVITMKNIITSSDNNKKIIENVISEFLNVQIEVRFCDLNQVVEEVTLDDIDIQSKVENLFKEIDEKIDIEIID